MGKNSISQKSQYLGMPMATATRRLSRQLLLHLLQKQGEDVCYKCKLRISSVEELTIEHIEPWYKRNLSLFWNLENIAFSHHRCNKVHKTNRKCEVGSYWCQHCRQCLPESRFGSPKDKDGLYKRSYCNLCRSARKKLGLSY